MEKIEIKKKKVAAIEFPSGPVVKTHEHVFIYMCVYVCVYIYIHIYAYIYVYVYVCMYIYGASLVAQTVDSALKTSSFHLMLVYPEAKLTN